MAVPAYRADRQWQQHHSERLYKETKMALLKMASLRSAHWAYYACLFWLSVARCFLPKWSCCATGPVLQQGEYAMHPPENESWARPIYPHKWIASFKAKHWLKGTGPLHAATGLTFAEHSLGLYGKCVQLAAATTKPTSVSGFSCSPVINLAFFFYNEVSGFPAGAF